MSLKKNFKNFSQNLKKIPPALTIWTWLVFCIVLAGGFFFQMRRLSGFFCRTVPTAGIFIFSAVFGITVLLLYFLVRAWSMRFPKHAVLMRRMMTVILILDYLLIGLAVQIPGTSALTWLVFTAFFLLTAGVLWWFEFHRPFSSSREPEPDSEPETDSAPELEPESTAETESMEETRLTEEPGSTEESEESAWESEEPDEEDELLPAGVRQKLERLENPDGTEEISGLLRAEFLPNQTKIPLFVGFCPPFCQTPVVECFSLDGTTDVEIVQNAPHGVQLSIRKKPRVPLEDSVILMFRAVANDVSMRNS